MVTGTALLMITNSISSIARACVRAQEACAAPTEE
jgi:hypothetical protein